MVGEPGGQGENATGEPCGLASQPDAGHSRRAAAFKEADGSQGDRDDDGRLLAERCGGKPQRGGPGLAVRHAILCRQRAGQPPQRAGGGEDIGVGQRALGEPDGVERGERHGPAGDGGHAHQTHGQPPDRREAECRGSQHGQTRDQRAIAEELPAERQVDAGKRRMGVAQRGDGDQ